MNKQDRSKWTLWSLSVIAKAVSGYCEDSIASPDYDQDRKEIEEAWELIRSAIAKPKYKILTKCVNDTRDDAFSFDDGDGCKPLRFNNIAEAQEEILVTVELYENAVKQGEMSADSTKYEDDYEIVPEWFPPHANVNENGFIV